MFPTLGIIVFFGSLVMTLLGNFLKIVGNLSNLAGFDG